MKSRPKKKITLKVYQKIVDKIKKKGKPLSATMEEAFKEKDKYEIV